MSAAGGAVALGTVGCAAGMLGGGAVGAVCGVVPALFTFGLSIPVGMAIGSGAGACICSTIGGMTGFLSGGALGYGVYSHREGQASAKDTWSTRPRDSRRESEQQELLHHMKG